MGTKSIIRFVKTLFHLNKDRYVYKKAGNKKWAYISYVPRVYYKKKDSPWFDKHQNRREALVIGEIFKRLGYNYVMATYNKTMECDKRKYDVIFGEGPCFALMSRRNPTALKIYYATTAYPKHQNAMVRLRTDSFNAKHGTRLAYSRLADSDIDNLPIDAILQIGSSVTVTTYPMSLRGRISLINQSSNLKRTVDLAKKTASYNRTHFVWMGSTGTLLKGLDLVLDYFMQHPEYHLHVVGMMDADFEAYYAPLLQGRSNITLWGFQLVNSDDFAEIMREVSFCLYPSASEGGCPGAVISLMKMGIIPLVSRWASFDGIEACGYVMDELSDSSVAAAVEWSQALSDSEVKERMERCVSLAESKWNLLNFERELEEYLRKIVVDFVPRRS